MMHDELARLDCTGLEVVATASSAKPGRRAWTELAIYFRRDPDTGRNFIAEVRGRYRDEEGKQGRDTTKRAYVGTIGRALEFFDDSSLTDSLAVSARDWVDRNSHRLAKPNGISRQNPARETPAGGYAGGNGLAGALSWLYEGEPGDLSKRLAADFGVPDRTVRDALKREAQGEKLTGWLLAFLAALSAFDRDTLPHRRGRA